MYTNKEPKKQPGTVVEKPPLTPDNSQAATTSAPDGEKPPESGTQKPPDPEEFFVYDDQVAAHSKCDEAQGDAEGDDADGSDDDIIMEGDEEPEGEDTDAEGDEGTDETPASDANANAGTPQADVQSSAVETKPPESTTPDPIAVSNANGDETITDPRKVFKPEYIPGEQEYIDRVMTDATKETCKRLGLASSEDFDPYNPKHQAMYQHIFNRLDSQESASFETAKKEHVEGLRKKKAADNFLAAKKKVEGDIDKLLPTKDLQDKYTEALGNMKFRDYNEMMKAATERHDFSALINLAKTVAGVKANLDKVRKPTPSKTIRSVDSGGEPPGKLKGSDVLGF
ncbi:MAG: hypothetical protein HQM09_15185 [Candidatus Riflebacteria bacterium]|nr:hypothetical protein [Candidatus Riflebacteria bacterium]